MRVDRALRVIREEEQNVLARLLVRAQRPLAAERFVATGALRAAAQSLHHSWSAPRASCRRVHAHLGAPEAITAVAHKLAHIVYRRPKSGQDYVDRGQDYDERS